jgi:hypothetical protein
MHIITTRRIPLGIAAATVLLGAAVAAPAYAGLPAADSENVQPATACPTVSATAQRLRAAGFAAQAAKNFGVFIRDDCLAERNAR